MDRVQQKDWIVFRQAAYSALRAGYVAEPAGSRIIQLLVLPALRGPVCCIETRTLRRQSSGYLLATLRWEVEQDADRIRAWQTANRLTDRPQPTITSRTQVRHDEIVERLLNQMRSAQIPAWVDDRHSGLDGTSYELALGEAFCYVRYHWWAELPESWQPLAPIVSAILDLSEKTFGAL